MRVLSDKGKKVLNSFEAPKGPDLTAYKDPAGVWTIAYGNTFYENGAKVRPGQTITLERANQLQAFVLRNFEKDVDSLLNPIGGSHAVTQGQFDALVLFAYNVGSDIDVDLIAEGLGDSTLMKKVLKNPSDPTIKAEFLKWNKAGGKVLAGLTRRRNAEIDLYYNG